MKNNPIKQIKTRNISFQAKLSTIPVKYSNIQIFNYDKKVFKKDGIEVYPQREEN